ncbi:MAG: energy transducer TonB, partial [Acetobacter sp.]|nr:energy transducer TonB [Acetobacter sp.]
NTLPNMVIPSHIIPTNKTKKLQKSQQDSHSLLATLDSFRSDQKYDSKSSTERASHRKNTLTNIVGSLTTSEQKAIGAEVRRCYTEDTEAKDYASFVAHLVVTVDATGEARIVQFAPETQARMNTDPSYRALAERARDAILSPTCAKLPIPKKLLGQPRQLKFVFRP